MRIYDVLTDEEYVVVKGIFVDATKKTQLKNQLNKTMDEIKTLRDSAKKKVKQMAEALKVEGPVKADYFAWFKQHLDAVKTLMEKQAAVLAAGAEKAAVVKEEPPVTTESTKKSKNTKQKKNSSKSSEPDQGNEKKTKKRKKTVDDDKEESKNKKRKLNDGDEKKKKTKKALNSELETPDSIAMMGDEEELFDPKQHEEEEEEEEDSDMERDLVSESEELETAEVEINRDRIYSIRCEDQVRYMWFHTTMEKKQFWTNLRAALRDKFPFKLSDLLDEEEEIDPEVVPPEFDIYKLKFKHIPFENLSSNSDKRNRMWKEMLDDENGQSLWHELIVQWLGNYLEWAAKEFFKKKESKEAK